LHQLTLVFALGVEISRYEATVSVAHATKNTCTSQPVLLSAALPIPDECRTELCRWGKVCASREKQAAAGFLRAYAMAHDLAVGIPPHYLGRMGATEELRTAE
jgi:hypothetical protein